MNQKLVRLTWILLIIGLLVFCSCGKTPDSSKPDPETSVKEQTETQGAESESEDVKMEIQYEGYQTPCIVPTYYSSDVIVADVVATDNGKYSADPHGVQDSTDAINHCISKVYNGGGGTVFLPAGSYKVTGTIKVLPFVSLVGDFDREGTGSTGTVILAQPPEDIPLFEIGGSAGVVGLSVYYPEQSLQDVREYGFTFSIPGSAAGPAYYMLSTVKDCRVFNGYKGVYAGSVNEQMNLDNISGTFLLRALELYDSADASTIQSVDAKSDYWASCSLGSESGSDIKDYTYANGEAFVFGDVEWCSFARLSCDSYSIGMHIVPGPRAKFSGIIYDCRMTGCQSGLLVDDIDTRPGYGMAVTGGLIEGEDYAVLNRTAGKVQLTCVELSGEVRKGSESDALMPVVNRTLQDKIPVLTEPEEPYVSSENLVVVKNADRNAKKDASVKIQEALDSLRESGGIVYLRAGNYLLDKPLVVPDGVELRGAGFVPVRDQMELSLGTILFSKVDPSCDDEETSKANLTLGNNSGLRNINLVNVSHDIFSDYRESGGFTPSSYLIRGQGTGCYIVNGSICGAVNGIELKEAPNARILHMSVLAYKTGIHLQKADHVLIHSVLTNVTIGMRNGWWKLDAYRDLFSNGWEENWEITISSNPDGYGTVHMMMDELNQILVDSCRDVELHHIFSYGARHTLEAYDSDILAVNIGRDCYWKYSISEPMIRLYDSTLRLYNMYRFNGSSYLSSESSVLIYSRVTIYEDEPCVEPQ